jgi:hypothetical protein
VCWITEKVRIVNGWDGWFMDSGFHFRWPEGNGIVFYPNDTGANLKTLEKRFFYFFEWNF